MDQDTRNHLHKLLSGEEPATRDVAVLAGVALNLQGQLEAMEAVILHLSGLVLKS